MNTETLKKAGINYDSGVKRFLGNSGLYEDMLVMFTEDNTCARAEQAYDEGKMKEFSEAVHEVKGVSGNLDMTELYDVSRRLMDELRSQSPDAGVIKELFTRFRDEYVSVKEAINNARSDS